MTDGGRSEPQSVLQGERLGSPVAGTVHEAVAAVAAARPDAVAVTDGRSTLTYRQPDLGAAALAEALWRRGMRRGDRVAVLLGPEVALPVALLGVLRCGAMCLPLDPEHPAARLAELTADAEPAALVARDRPAWAAGWAPPIAMLPPNGHPAAAARPVELDDRDAAYLIYTSGSTGRPKGVVVEHRNVTALLAACRRAVPTGPGAVWTMCHSPAFDFSVWELWGCLASGGALVLVPRTAVRDPRRLRDLLLRHRVTVLSQTPTAFTMLARHVADGPRLAVRTLVFGGEPLDTGILRGWFDRYPPSRCRVLDMYGITETTVHTTARTVAAAVPPVTGLVGGPLPGESVYVLGPDQRLRPRGAAGEICVGGAGVARGYWKRPGLTADRFRPDPVTGGRLYRSGDLGRVSTDGGLAHLGRIDDQVKVAGHRVELGELRRCLLDHPAVHAADVLAGDHGLDAFVAGAVTPAAARRWLAERLPAPVLPRRVHVLDDLPVTENGKLHRDALRELARHAGPAGADVASGSLVDSVCAIWQQLVGQPVGADDNFFELGGSSLLAVEATERMAAAGLGRPAVDDLYRNPTPRGMARRVAS